MLKVMIVDTEKKREQTLKQSLIKSGFEVVAHVDCDARLDLQCAANNPDVVIIDADSPDRDTLENICVMSMHSSKPVVMFSHDGDKDKIKAATQAGVSAYVVGTIPSERLAPVIDAAIARFEEFSSMRNELAATKLKLEERKVIEQAKGLLMKQRNLDEDEAYKLLREMAMQRNIKLADLSRQLLDVAKMLIT